MSNDKLDKVNNFRWEIHDDFGLDIKYMLNDVGNPIGYFSVDTLEAAKRRATNLSRFIFDRIDNNEDSNCPWHYFDGYSTGIWYRFQTKYQACVLERVCLLLIEQSIYDVSQYWLLNLLSHNDFTIDTLANMVRNEGIIENNNNSDIYLKSLYHILFLNINNMLDDGKIDYILDGKSILYTTKFKSKK